MENSSQAPEDPSNRLETLDVVMGNIGKYSESTPIQVRRFCSLLQKTGIVRSRWIHTELEPNVIEVVRIVIEKYGVIHSESSGVEVNQESIIQRSRSGSKLHSAVVRVIRGRSHLESKLSGFAIIQSRSCPQSDSSKVGVIRSRRHSKSETFGFGVVWSWSHME